MNRRHARPMSAHQRARRVRGAAYEGAQLVTFLLLGLMVILAAAVTGPYPAP